MDSVPTHRSTKDFGVHRLQRILNPKRSNSTRRLYNRSHIQIPNVLLDLLSIIKEGAMRRLISPDVCNKSGVHALHNSLLRQLAKTEAKYYDGKDTHDKAPRQRGNRHDEMPRVGVFRCFMLVDHHKSRTCSYHHSCSVCHRISRQSTHSGHG